MGVASKHRRKISVGGRQYVWAVYEDDEDYAGQIVLRVISTDKHFIATYPLGQPQGRERTIVVSAAPGGGRRCLDGPQFTTAAVTPSQVRQLIEWCLDETGVRGGDA